MFTNLSNATTFTFITVVNTVRMLGIAMVMMPVTTAGLNQLPDHLIPHGTAMNNTMRQVAGAIGTALLVTVMTSHALPEKGINGIIHGVNVSFFVAGTSTLIALIMSLFIKNAQDEGVKMINEKRIG
jgi:hypothetical protein